ncbi:GGDEF domain-containing protein [Rubrivivax sp. A210]|uniref:GGDEF domain-containing protein n=1 Tax=Rubrivivax sp. A210 TaxID=2772301 RepID=UPI0019196800|nr:GGDEF domain-containing protein [Rubrivivax sp. A210]CAD5372258.1 GGDEF domain-containing protein [Rubrivivax sp. A210]
MTNPHPLDQAVAAARLHALLDRCPVAAAYVQAQRFTAVGAQMNQLFGCADEAGLAGEPTRAVHGSDACHAGVQQRMAEAYARQHPFTEEIEYARRDGSRFWGRLRAMPLDWADASGEALWLIDDVSAERRQREHPTWASSHDDLTELCNRREFERRLADHVGSRRHEPVSVLHIDLDRFALVTEQFGQAGGDHALFEIATLLQAKVRASDIVARLEADHFAVLLPACDEHWAQLIADKLRLAIGQFRVRWGDKRARVPACVGVVQLSPAMAAAEEVLAAAAAACREAKEAGRNCVRVHRATEPAPSA